MRKIAAGVLTSLLGLALPVPLPAQDPAKREALIAVEQLYREAQTAVVRQELAGPAFKKCRSSSTPPDIFKTGSDLGPEKSNGGLAPYVTCQALRARKPDMCAVLSSAVQPGEEMPAATECRVNAASLIFAHDAIGRSPGAASACETLLATNGHPLSGRLSPAAAKEFCAATVKAQSSAAVVAKMSSLVKPALTPTDSENMSGFFGPMLDAGYKCPGGCPTKEDRGCCDMLDLRRAAKGGEEACGKDLNCRALSSDDPKVCDPAFSAVRENYCRALAPSPEASASVVDSLVSSADGLEPKTSPVNLEWVQKSRAMRRRLSEALNWDRKPGAQK